MLCPDAAAEAVIAALCAAHPYEEPAWDLTEVRAPRGAVEAPSTGPEAR